MGGLWRAGIAPAADHIEKILDVGVTIHVGVRWHRSREVLSSSRSLVSTRSVGIHIAGRSRCDAIVIHAGIDVIDVVVTIAVEVAEGGGFCNTTATVSGFGLQWIFRAAVVAIGRTVEVGVGLQLATAAVAGFGLQRIVGAVVATIGRAITVGIGIVIVARALVQVIKNAIIIRVFGTQVTTIFDAGFRDVVRTADEVDLIWIVTTDVRTADGGVAPVAEDPPPSPLAMLPTILQSVMVGLLNSQKIPPPCCWSGCLRSMQPLMVGLPSSHVDPAARI